MPCFQRLLNNRKKSASQDFQSSPEALQYVDRPFGNVSIDFEGQTNVNGMYPRTEGDWIVVTPSIIIIDPGS